MFNRPDHNNPRSWTSRFRLNRFKTIENLIRKFNKSEKIKILDVGGRRDYWNLLSKDIVPRTSITLFNFESELNIHAVENDPLEIQYMQGDGCDMPEFQNQSFDLVHSNSVIEHVGSLQNMARFADEVRRVGNAYYIQTPYLWFPIEPHYGVPFVHWLPGPARAQLLNHYKLGYAGRVSDYRTAIMTADHTQIVDKKLMHELFPDGVLLKERFALMTKSLIVTREPNSMVL